MRRAPWSLIFSELIEEEVRGAGSHLDVDEAFVEKLAFIYDTFRFGFMVFLSLFHFSIVFASF